MSVAYTESFVEAHLAATAKPESSTQPATPTAPTRGPATGLRILAGGRAGTRVPRTVTEGVQVPTLNGETDYANLDHAATTPALLDVEHAVTKAQRYYSSVHRGNGYLSVISSQWYEQARAQVGAFVGARRGDSVVFTRNTTDSFALLAKALPRSTTVVVFESEHHSTLLTWRAAGRSVIALPVPRDIDEAIAAIDTALATVRTQHALVVVAGASNVTGEIWPIERVVATARLHGARVAVDAAQLAPHRRINIAVQGVDYVAFSGHKLYAPYGAGALVGRADWLDQARPYLAGGGSTASNTATGPVWSQGVARHEGGTPNLIGAIALAAACHTIAEQWPAVEAHEHALHTALIAGLEQIPGVQIHTMFGPGTDQVGVVSFTVGTLDSSLVSAVLAAEHGIGVRDGKFCAHLLVDELLEDPWGELPTTAVRASIGLATTAAHVERLVAAVTDLALEGPARTYRNVDGRWCADGDRRAAALPAPWL